MDQLLQHLLNGLLLGATYSLLGIGLTLVFGLMNVVNFAHGEFYTLGAYAVFAALAAAGVNFFLAIALAIAVGRRGGRRVRARPPPAAPGRVDRHRHAGDDRAVDRDAERRAPGLGRRRARACPRRFRASRWQWAAVSVSPLRIFVFVASACLIIGAHLLLARTKLGRAMRATFQDRETAALMGVSIERIHTITFAFGAGLAAAAGALLGPVFLLYPSMGDLASLKAFSVVILGGLGNFVGAALGGLVLGVAEELGAGYVSSGYRDAVGFVIIVAVLLLRPSGLFARAERVG